MRFVVLIAMAVAACGSSNSVPQYPGIGESHHVEAKKLPPRPDAQAIAKEDNWSEPLPSATCTVESTGETVATKDGVLISPDKAIRAIRFKDSYNNLRDLYEIDRQIIGAQRVVYEERLAQANSEIRRLSPSWFDRNKGTLGWVGGFVAGAVTTVAIVYAVDEVN